MSNKQRTKRPTPQRTSPQRNRSGLLRDKANAAATQAQPGQSAQTPATGAYSAVDEGVAAGYRVHDEYMRRGQHTASQHRPPSAQRGYGAPAGYGAASSIAQAMQGWSERAMRGYWEWANTWMQMMAPMALSPWRMAEQFARFGGMPGMPPTAPPFAPPGSMPGAYPGVVPGWPTPPDPRYQPDNPAARQEEVCDSNVGVLTMDIVVETSQRVRATMELSSDSAGEMTVRPLRCSRSRSNIEGATVVLHNEGASVAIQVPDGQPAGHYVGGIFNLDSGAQVGAISLEVMATVDPKPIKPAPKAAAARSKGDERMSAATEPGSARAKRVTRKDKSKG